MSKATKILSLTTAVFFASTVYLAVELHRRDAPPLAIQTVREMSDSKAHVALSDHRERATAGMPAGVRDGSANPATFPTAPAASAPQATTATTDAAIDMDPGKVFARQLLARYDDSSQRPALVEDARANARRQYARLKDQLRLSDNTFEQLIALLAEQQLDAQVSWARCAVDPRCDPDDSGRTPLNDRSQEFLALLGADRIDTFQQYRDSLVERDAVAQLRGRLPDTNFLPQAQADQLVAALAEERRRYSDEMTQQGAKLQGWGTNLGMLWYPDHARTVEQQLLEAAQYSQRLRTRAATLLSPAQLAAYVQMQEELLAQMAAHFRPPPRKNSPVTLQAG
jgi:hypothetical protein